MKSLYESILSSTQSGKDYYKTVDLGLSVNWCSCNLGAEKPEEAGLYFAWGDTKGYKESEIKGDMFTEEWYNTLTASKIKGDLKLKYNAANKYMKGKWRMPTTKEFQELKANTKQEIEVLNSIKGIHFTANNGNSIFIPFAGFAVDSSVKGTGNVFYCWSSVVDSTDDAYNFYCIYSGNTDEGCGGRYLGFSIRPVCDK